MFEEKEICLSMGISFVCLGMGMLSIGELHRKSARNSRKRGVEKREKGKEREKR